MYGVFGVSGQIKKHIFIHMVKDNFFIDGDFNAKILNPTEILLQKWPPLNTIHIELKYCKW